MESMHKSLTLGSLFDGIGGWQLAAVRNGIKPIWSSEIEPYPMAVTKYHFPDTIQLGDITKLRGEELPPVDIICAGSPCQDLSVASRQKGLQGERSGLFYQSIRLFYAMRRATGGRYPRYFIWENVPGAFSSNHGQDFLCVLEEIGQTRLPMPEPYKWAKAGLVELPECQIAWCVLDAQYWGVPQCRAHLPCRRFWNQGATCRRNAICRSGPAAESLPEPRSGQEDSSHRHYGRHSRNRQHSRDACLCRYVCDAPERPYHQERSCHLPCGTRLQGHPDPRQLSKGKTCEWQRLHGNPLCERLDKAMDGQSGSILR